MMEFTLWDFARNLLLAARWTLLLSGIAFAGGVTLGLVLLAIRVSKYKRVHIAIKLYVELFQSTPLLMQLFLVFFGLPMLGFDVPAWVAASLCLTLYASAYLTDIWRGCVEAIPRGQWDASASLGLRYLAQLRFVILPLALRTAIPPTVGFMVQLVKGTALASIIGFSEVTRTAQILTNATFQPFIIFGMAALIYFIICFPLTVWARRMEQHLSTER
ncbi:MAG: amino acid ABC transporter permease [Pseudomonadota bacterium]